MAKRKDIDITWVEELFTENESVCIIVLIQINFCLKF